MDAQIDWSPRRSAHSAHHRPGHAASPPGRTNSAGPRGPRFPRHSFRQSRHRPVDETAGDRAADGDGAPGRRHLAAVRCGRSMVSTTWRATRSDLWTRSRSIAPMSFGASMGGMIAQIIAADYPERVKTLVSLMSTSGRPTLPGPSPRVLRSLLRPRLRRSSERGIAQSIEFLRLIGSPGYPTGDAELRAKVERGFRPPTSSGWMDAPSHRRPGGAQPGPGAPAHPRPDAGLARGGRPAHSSRRRPRHRRQHSQRPTCQ